jgi:hypothetical protein
MPRLSIIPLRSIETDALLSVKSSRSRAEYCWTLTPFTPTAVIARDATVRRVTFVDADLLFFSPPRPLFQELENSGKHVLLTEHAFDPRYDQTSAHGRFCVQFMPFANTPEGRALLEWWQTRCLEWCHQCPEDGRFGDQKYLDSWPALFPETTHVLTRPELTLAPWNVEMFVRRYGEALQPVFYHFQGFRLVEPGLVRLATGYPLHRRIRRFYSAYLEELRGVARLLAARGYTMPVMPDAPRSFGWVRRLKRRLSGQDTYEAFVVE